jgi:hypothetical protein
MRARPFVLVGDSALEELRVRCARAASEWAAGWGVVTGDPTVACERLEEATAAEIRWSSWRPAGEPLAWVGAVSGFRREFARGLGTPEGIADASTHASLADDLQGEAFSDLVEALLAALRGKPSQGLRLEAQPLAPHLFAPGSGAIFASITLGSSVLAIVVPDPHLPRPVGLLDRVGTAPPSVGLVEAAQAALVTVRAEIGEAEVELGALQALAPGDVIRLGRGVAEAVDVVGPGGDVVCRGHLGMFEGRRALELVP